MEVDANPRHGAGQRDNREQQQRVADRLRPSSTQALCRPSPTCFRRPTAISFTNDANSGRFQILKRWNDTILGNVGTAGQQTDKSSVVVDEFLSLRSLPCAYKAAGTGAIGDIEQGALYLITVGDNAAGNTDSDAILVPHAFPGRVIQLN